MNSDNNNFNKNLLYLFIILFGIIVLYFMFCKTTVKGGNTKDIFVLYYVNWCPHCREVKPEWNKLEKENLDNVTIKKVNCEENENISQEKNIEGFPTIQLEKSNGEIIPYEDNRDYNAFIVFLNKNLNN
jgi:thiol-disulfide isomerase/thioredoxin